jgi:hypothetical protein
MQLRADSFPYTLLKKFRSPKALRAHAKVFDKRHAIDLVKS